MRSATKPNPDEHRYTYAVGDLHGRLDLLAAAVEAIESHAGRAPYRIVFLGDYVDRGPDSRGVVEFLIALQARLPVVCLKGNHEALMCMALSDPGRGNKRRWLDNGGEQTLHSYGLTWSGDTIPTIPAKHTRWLNGLPLTASDAHRVFVHAGLTPRTPLHLQSEQSCLWIRERFLAGHAVDFESHVVHGHTPLWRAKPSPAEPELLEHRTNLDTGAFATGVLAVGIFDAEQTGGPVAVLRIVGEPAAWNWQADASSIGLAESVFD